MKQQGKMDFKILKGQSNMAADNKIFFLKYIVLRVAPALLVLALGASFFACSQTDKDPGNALEKVTIACATPPYTVLTDIALAKGYFRQQGLEVAARFHSTAKRPSMGC
jgi:hypothetical protein